MNFDPSGITESITAIGNLITKSLPSDEERLARLKLNSPRIYARIRRHLTVKIIRFCKHNKLDMDATKAYTLIETGALPASEQLLFCEVVLSELFGEAGFKFATTT